MRQPQHTHTQLANEHIPSTKGDDATKAATQLHRSLLGSFVGQRQSNSNGSSCCTVDRFHGLTLLSFLFFHTTAWCTPDSGQFCGFALHRSRRLSARSGCCVQGLTRLNAVEGVSIFQFLASLCASSLLRKTLLAYHCSTMNNHDHSVSVMLLGLTAPFSLAQYHSPWHVNVSVVRRWGRP